MLLNRPYLKSENEKVQIASKLLWYEWKMQLKKSQRSLSTKKNQASRISIAPSVQSRPLSHTCPSRCWACHQSLIVWWRRLESCPGKERLTKLEAGDWNAMLVLHITYKLHVCMIILAWFYACMYIYNWDFWLFLCITCLIYLLIHLTFGSMYFPSGYQDSAEKSNNMSAHQLSQSFSGKIIWCESSGLPRPCILKTDQTTAHYVVQYHYVMFLYVFFVYSSMWMTPSNWKDRFPNPNVPRIWTNTSLWLLVVFRHRQSHAYHLETSFMV